MTPELGQPASQLRLENHHQRDCEEYREAAQDPADHDQVQQGRDQSEGEKDNRQPGQHFGAARAAKVNIAVVNSDTEQNDFNDAAPAFEPELQNLLHHDSTLSVIRNAVTFSFTS